MRLFRVENLALHLHVALMVPACAPLVSPCAQVVSRAQGKTMAVGIQLIYPIAGSVRARVAVVVQICNLDDLEGAISPERGAGFCIGYCDAEQTKGKDRSTDHETECMK